MEQATTHLKYTDISPGQLKAGLKTWLHLLIGGAAETSFNRSLTNL